MEQHPIPRNITGFQFRLVGDMTVKQFGYLIGGCIIGFVMIKLPLPALMTWPIGIGSALLGVGLAFVPIQERPLDVWLLAFIKNVYAPTQFIWRKNNDAPAILLATIAGPRTKVAAVDPTQLQQYQESRKKLDAYLSTLPKTARQTIDLHEQARLSQTSSMISTHYTKNSAGSTPPSPVASPTTTASVFKPLVKPAVPVVPSPSVQIPAAEKIVAHQPLPPIAAAVPPQTPPVAPRLTTVVVPEPSPVIQASTAASLPTPKAEPLKTNAEADRLKKLEEQLSQLLEEKNSLATQLSSLKMQNQKDDTVKPTQFMEAQIEEQVVKIITPKVAKNAGFPSIPHVPNIISGIIKDGLGNLLPNILITIKDKDGTPLRALKTNKLGQFAASTPLPTGVYTIDCEDPQKRFNFAIIEMTLTGDLVTPLEILARSERELHREKLMKEIFGTSA